MNKEKAGLFGLQNTNKDFTQQADWGKNTFNNSFPTSLTCYMGSKNINPKYLVLTETGSVKITEIPVVDLFGLKPLSNNLSFIFERQFSKYSPMVVDTYENIDLVTRDSNAERELRDLEIKLTAIPDDATSDLPIERQGAELVIRPPTTDYLGLHLASLFLKERNSLYLGLHAFCSQVKDWTSVEELIPLQAEVIDLFDEICISKIDEQKPLIMQPIWRTEGKQPILEEDCFDVFVWSDLAFTRLFVDSARNPNRNRITRTARTVFWMIRMLQDFSMHGKFNPSTIKDEMSLGTNNDKAFSVNGNFTNNFMACEELIKPRCKKDVVREIILGDGYKLLSPERRLDAAILMTQGLFPQG